MRKCDCFTCRLLLLRNVQRLAVRGAPDLLTGRDAEMQKLNLAGMKEWGPLFPGIYCHGMFAESSTVIVLHASLCGMLDFS
jgi:hypothetical protein